MNMADSFFQVSDLSVVFGGLTALNGLDFHIEQGQIVGLIGPNGAGKTTAFNVISGRMKPTSGRVRFKGVDITGWPAPRVAQAGITRTFQSIKLYEDLTVIENVMVAAHSKVRYSFVEAIVGLGRFSREERRVYDQAQELLKLMGLAEQAHEKAGVLPYGSQRKLEIARALALEPSLLLLDEPVAGMNPVETRDFTHLLKRMNRDMGLTIGLIDHDMKFVMNVCNRIKVIDHGLPIAWGTPDEICQDERVIRAYLGQGF
ncbi:MAG: branched-chain amino acid transport system ATP-binding protein [Thermodesulfobacteriota bacterium]|nr:branched-chain amino acid transport system ATP-binding protein [Thermodesulfobacteriota bacterium]